MEETKIQDKPTSVLHPPADSAKMRRRRKRLQLQTPGPYHRPRVESTVKTPMPAAIAKPPIQQATASMDCSPVVETETTVRKVRETTQCFKCQLWGHLSYTCTNETKCVRCGLGHRANDCPKLPNEPPTCANCSLHHTANYRGCKAAPKPKRARRRRKKVNLNIPGLPDGSFKNLVTVIAKLITRENFFTEEQLAVIAKEMVAASAPAKPKAPPTITDFVPRPLQIKDSHEMAPSPAAMEIPPTPEMTPSPEQPTETPEESQVAEPCTKIAEPDYVPQLAAPDTAFPYKEVLPPPEFNPLFERWPEDMKEDYLTTRQSQLMELQGVE